MPVRHIQVLPDAVANQIAAGEVVDRPASVLKELVENALDAGATQIDVEIALGGRKLIRVADNGCGMNRDDALLAIERHATSKIREVHDIERIATLGFRGEALAAISSVSRFILQTRDAESAAGAEVLVSGGRLREVRELGCPVGTVIEVRDLFFNVPARRKFLRSAQTEAGHLRLAFVLMALGRPEAGLSLTVDGRVAYSLAAGATLEDRVRDLFGKDYLGGLRAVDHDQGGIRVTGYAGLPAVARADRSEQHIFVNGRAAAAPVIPHAVREGYRTLLPSDRHPILILFIELDPGMVDVNVHPTKRDVRFRDGVAVRDAVAAALRKALASDGAALLSGAQGPAAPAGPPSFRADSATPPLPIEDLPPVRTFQYPRLPIAEPRPAGPAAPAPGAQAPVAGMAGEPAAAGAAPAPGAPRAPAGPWAWCRVLGQVGSLYVVLETEEGLVLMDPHAAHERVLFEKFMREVAARRVESQGLLVPDSVDLSPGDAVQCRRNLELLRKLGFGVSEFGGDTFVVDALPACLADAPAGRLLAAMAAELERSGERGAGGRWSEEAVAQAACKAAVKSRDRLSLREIEQLVIALASAEMPYTCPHGRPTLILMSYAELNRKFGRE